MTAGVLLGLLRVVKQQVNIPVHVMVRPRAGDFHYSDQEMDVMRTDIKILKENGADGFVLGLLHRSREFLSVTVNFGNLQSLTSTRVDLKPNSITLSGRRQVQSWSQTCSELEFCLLFSLLAAI